MRDAKEPPNKTNKSHAAGHESRALTAVCTFAAALDLPAAEKGIVDEVWQAAVEVNGGQAALEALPGDHELGEVLVHVGAQTSDEQVACRQKEGVRMKNERVGEFNWITLKNFCKVNF